MTSARLWRSAAWLSLALVGPAAAQQSVDALAWMAGDWRSEGGDNLVQEVWTDPRAGTMTGMFRLVRGGEVAVLEYVVITEVGGGVYYQFKHFRPDYSTWEGENPPIRMKLVESAPGRAVFRNTRKVEGEPSHISYLLGEDGRITVLVGEAPTTSGDYSGFQFVLTRSSD